MKRLVALIIAVLTILSSVFICSAELRTVVYGENEWYLHNRYENKRMHNRSRNPKLISSKSPAER